MIDTLRLYIFPLSYDRVLKYKDSKNELEKELKVNESKWKHSDEVIKMLEERLIPRLIKNIDKYIFNTIWLVIDKSKNVIVADFGIKGNPEVRNGKNEIEIGYGTQPEFQGKGYMTEAIGGFINWADKRDDIDTILANTDKSNIASVKVLEKNGFEKFNEIENEFCWKKDVS